ncbi:kinetochore protein Nuf2 isoform X2 [Phalaenopsis equestris]|uniref:kinetochore protein Nuf2 isoform X2 n=1 Tax=Phalaenopsis equestris TaxID=78828 RepID=UPI0009E57F37|nr:kinetochore protein Nuf2 isoform X2 [Phalaenopsis equestris]
MSSAFYCPEMSAAQIAGVLNDSGIANISESDLAAPTADLACALYASVINYFQPLREDVNADLDFGALQLLDNPEYHEEAIRAINLFHRMNEFLVSINCDGFKLSDLLMPEPRRMILIFSAIVNFLYYREEKLAALQVFMDKLPACDERRSELEEKLAVLKKQCMDYEVARKKEEPMVHELDADVNKLKQSIQEYNKQQMLMRNQAKELKEKADAIDSKISQADFELLKKAEENNKLLSEVVQSPDKLQRTLEEKRKKLSEVKNSERMSIQSVHEKNTALEVCSKASEKLSKLLALGQATQEQINSAKNIEKDLKALKLKLSNDAVSDMSLEAKMFELQGKVKQAEELLRATEKERQVRQTEDIQKLNNARAEVEEKLKSLEQRERKLEDMVARIDSLRQEADSVREREKLKQQKLLSKLEELVHALPKKQFT